MKSCITCNIEKPLSDFPFNKKMKDGHLNRCKACCYALEKAKRKPRIKAEQTGFKICAQCKTEKSESEFCKNKKTGRLGYCKLCMSAYQRNRYICVYKKVSLPPVKVGGNKICAICLEEKNKTDFHQNKLLQDGLMAFCKSCHANNATRGNLNRVIVYEKTGIFKHCPKCKKDLDTSNFHNDRKSKDGKAWYCRACFKKPRFVYGEKEYTPKEPKGKYRYNKLNDVDEFVRLHSIIDEDFDILD